MSYKMRLEYRYQFKFKSSKPNSVHGIHMQTLLLGCQYQKTVMCRSGDSESYQAFRGKPRHWKDSGEGNSYLQLLKTLVLITYLV